MLIVISPQARSLPPPRQWIGCTTHPVRVLGGNRNSAASALSSGDPEQRATPMAHQGQFQPTRGETPC